MSIADHAAVTSRVRRQYEDFPYPMREPADEQKRLLATWLDDLDVLNHYCFKGRQNFNQGFRALVAGGGTGDSTIYLAHQLRHTKAEIVYLDLSQTSMEIVKKRIRYRNLENRVTFINGSLLELDRLDLEPFDYISCTGVLHHLQDPQAGLASLRGALKDNGAMGLMVYGKYGRSGIYEMQEMMRLVNHQETDGKARVDHAKAMLSSLPATNMLKMKPGKDYLEKYRDNDAEIYDLFLHSQDRPFTVMQLYELLDSVGLNLTEFVPQYRALYDPEMAFRSPELLNRVKQLPKRQQQAATELYWQSVGKHEFWASPQTDTIVPTDDPENIPFIGRQGSKFKIQEAFAKATDKFFNLTMQHENGQRIKYKIHLHPVSRKFIELIDSKRTLKQITDEIVRQDKDKLTSDQVWTICQDVLSTMMKIDLLQLRHSSTPALPID